MILCTPDLEQQNYTDKKMVFLAGPIMGAEDWQSRAIADLADYDIYLASPRKAWQPGYNLDMQIDWESRHLARADIILFWLPLCKEKIPDRDYAQTTRFELGEWLAKTQYNLSNKKVILGIEEGFYGRSYIVKRLENTAVQVYSTYEETLNALKNCLSRQQNIYFTADTHFGSERTLNFSKRPFSSTAEMDEYLIKAWNKTVAKNDIVYHLGDFGNLAVRPHLNGQIHLILGNYEENEIQNNPQYLEQLHSNFSSVQKNATIILKDGTSVFLTHKPSTCPKGNFCVYGHIHGRRIINHFGMDAGVDGHHFLPISENDVLFYKNAIINHYDYEVFI